ncbi:MAG: HD domain-containing protein [Chloroflexota bacterium]
MGLNKGEARLGATSKRRITKEVMGRAKEYFTGARPSHDWSHTERVYQTCLKIGPREGADCFVLGLAALLHDIGREDEYASNGAVCHAEASLAKAREILSGYDLPAGDLENVLHCIAAHRYRGEVAPSTLEARVLSDADKLDALGAIGVARAYLWLGEFGRPLYDEPESSDDVMARLPEDDSLQREWLVKLRYLKDRMHTESARRIAASRHRYMERYLRRLEREVKGRA